MPIVNPVGIVNFTRSNGNGVDLMRNSPLDGEEKGGPLYPGHRHSKRLPWIWGILGAEMEVEVKAIMDVMEKEILTSRIALTVDVHSGFGAQNRFWFPYAHSRKAFPYLPEAYGLKKLYEQTYPHHFYIYEPMSRQYTIHGDPWDYILNESRKKADHGLFIPYTLEMGSWAWLKKNPTQIFSKMGVFHPMMPHRAQPDFAPPPGLFDFLPPRALVTTLGFTKAMGYGRRICNAPWNFGMATARPHTWILIRGLTREKGHWGNFTGLFRDRFPGDEVLAIDLPGFGDLYAQTSPAQYR